jgi:MFS transporter, FSR family, fosmidomycin resistance protein
MSAHGGGDRPGERPPGETEKEFDLPGVLTISGAHFAHDTYPAFLAPLLPLLIAKLSIPLAAAGALATIARLPFLMQPFMGVWADRADARYFVIAGPTLTAICMSSLGLAPSYLALVVLLLVAGVSSSAFHPAAAAAASRASGRTWGRGASIYMTGGELGRAAGPLFIVAVVVWVGLERSYIAAIPGFIFSSLLFWQLSGTRAPKMRGTTTKEIWDAVKAQRRPLLLLAGLVLFRSTAITSFVTFFPTYLVAGGSSIVFAGFAMTVFELAGAGGALVGGTLSDRVGRRKMMLVSQIVSGPLLFGALVLGDGPLGLLALALAGAMAISASPVQLTLAQELLPGSRSTASGIVFFLSFEGSLFTLVVGVLADFIGLGPAMGFSILASMLSIPFTLAMPEPRNR